MRGKTNFILILFTAIICSCQTNQKPKYFDYGKVENNIYNNSFFGFKITLPPEWIIQSKEQTENMVKVGKELLTGDDNNLKATIKASEINSAFLLTLFQYEVGALVNYNPSLVLAAENLKLTPGIKNGSDYLFQTRKLLKQSQIQYNHIDNEFKKIKIDNHDFYNMNLNLDHTGINIKQNYYSIVRNGFSIIAIISFVTDEQKKELKKMLNSFEFEK